MCRKQTQLQDHQSAANVCLSSKILCIYIVFWIFFRWLLIQSWISCDDKLVRKSVWSDLLHVASSESLNMTKTHTLRVLYLLDKKSKLNWQSRKSQITKNKTVYRKTDHIPNFHPCPTFRTWKLKESMFPSDFIFFK